MTPINFPESYRTAPTYLVRARTMIVISKRSRVIRHLLSVRIGKSKVDYGLCDFRNFGDSVNSPGLDQLSNLKIRASLVSENAPSNWLNRAASSGSSSIEVEIKSVQVAKLQSGPMPKSSLGLSDRNGVPVPIKIRAPPGRRLCLQPKLLTAST